MKFKIKNARNGWVIDINKELIVAEDNPLNDDVFEVRKFLYHLLDAMGIYFSRKNLHLEIKVIDWLGKEVENEDSLRD